MKLMKNILKPICFVLLFIFIFAEVSEVFGLKQLEYPWNMSNKINGLRNEPKDSIDVMYFGSSHMYSSINPVVVWKETGIPSYVYATQQQPVWISYYYMKEALKVQKPKVMVMELFMTKEEKEYMEESVNRPAIDLLPFSWNKVEMIESAVPEGERAPYYIDFIKYHNRWNDLEEEDFRQTYLEEKDALKGYVPLAKISPMKDGIDVREITEVGALPEKVREYLLKIIALSKEEGFELVLYKAPSHATAEEKKIYNAVEELANKEQIAFIDYNEYIDELGIESQSDFYDRTHLNIQGAEKVSKHFSQYIKEAFNLENKQDTTLYEAWQESVHYYEEEKKAFTLSQIKEPLAYLEAIRDSGYDIIITSKNEKAFTFLEESLLMALSQVIGEPIENDEGHFIAFVAEDKGVIVNEIDTLQDYLTEAQLPLTVLKDESMQFTVKSITFGEKEYSMNKAAINILVYDSFLGRVVSQVGLSSDSNKPVIK